MKRPEARMKLQGRQLDKIANDIVTMHVISSHMRAHADYYERCLLGVHPLGPAEGEIERLRAVLREESA